MLALALDDFTLLVVDIETKRVVRKFAGHHGNINDMVGHQLTGCSFRDIISVHVIFDHVIFDHVIFRRSALTAAGW